MASFTLRPSGYERSVIILHFPGWYFLGITPSRLTCTRGADPGANGPSIFPFLSSVCRYSSMTWGGLSRWKHVLDCWFKLPGLVYSYTEAILNTTQNILYIVLVWVLLQFPLPRWQGQRSWQHWDPLIHWWGCWMCMRIQCHELGPGCSGSVHPTLWTYSNDYDHFYLV